MNIVYSMKKRLSNICFSSINIFPRVIKYLSKCYILLVVYFVMTLMDDDDIIIIIAVITFMLGDEECHVLLSFRVLVIY